MLTLGNKKLQIINYKIIPPTLDIFALKIQIDTTEITLHSISDYPISRKASTYSMRLALW